MSVRDQVVANAKYLRSVRPIDPAEVDEYVAEHPGEDAVRDVLRDEAVDLGLVERDDGTFVPVEEGAVAPTFRGVRAFPDRYADRLESLLVDRFGDRWYHGDAGDALRAAIRRLKERYYRQHPVEYDATAALGYAVYHLPDNYAVAQYAVDDLGRAGLLPRSLRVLDVGAGVGGPALGLHDYLPDDALVDYHAVEPSAAVDVLRPMLAETGHNFHTTVHRETAEAFDPDGEYDLLLFANVLNELDDPMSVVERYLDHLAPDGALLAVAPADLNTSTGLREVERAVADGRERVVYSPTVRLWDGYQPADRGWSFDVKPDLAVPSFQRRLASAADEDGDAYVNVDVQYSHFVLRTDGRRRYDVDLDASAVARMADMERHVTRRVDCVAVKLSHSLSDDGNPVFKVGDGSETVEQYAVLVKETSLNDALARANYGDLLAFENVLVLWNDDEAAYNLVVDEETVVDVAAAA
ncbi:small ribosomal subunit Rsm22 family protein [Halobacteriaceae archaeon GCM10025711]